MPQDSYTTVASAIRFIREHARSQPSLGEVASAVGLSESHLQRVFSEWAGISPKRFLQFLTKEHARQALRQSADLVTASLDAGLSGPGRLHDLMVNCEAMTPGEIKARGAGVTLSVGYTATPFGAALVAWTSRGVCHLDFCDDDEEQKCAELLAEWPNASLERDDAGAVRLAERIFTENPESGSLHLLLRGTNFQIKVWEALLNIGPSTIASYSTLASLAGSPKAQRAVGTAMAANRLGFLIPCHRVIRESGEVGVYRWGSDRKAAMQAWEAARGETS